VLVEHLPQNRRALRLRHLRDKHRVSVRPVDLDNLACFCGGVAPVVTP
jgi:hypothetical protein